MLLSAIKYVAMHTAREKTMHETYYVVRRGYKYLDEWGEWTENREEAHVFSHDESKDYYLGGDAEWVEV